MESEKTEDKPVLDEVMMTREEQLSLLLLLERINSAEVLLRNHNTELLRAREALAAKYSEQGKYQVRQINAAQQKIVREKVEVAPEKPKASPARKSIKKVKG